MNGQRIEAWDPFLEDEDATQRQPPELLEFNAHRIEVFPYVLPHHTWISREVHERAAGPRGWNAQQGFYVYRNRRLLVADD